MTDFIKLIKKEKLIPIVKFSSLSEVLPTARALLDGGFNSIEIIFDLECAEEAIALIRRSYPNITVIAGSVFSKELVDKAFEAGAQLISSPGINTELSKYCIEKNIPIIPGCVNASEIQRALSIGIDIIKFFPAEQSGGVKTLNALCQMLPNISIIPTGGINEKNIKGYLEHPNVIACSGTFVAPIDYIKENKMLGITKLCNNIQDIINPKAEQKVLPKRVSPIELSVKFNSDKKFDIMSLGELLVRLTAAENERISQAQMFEKSIGGAELNVVAGAANLGLKTAILTKLPENLVTDNAISAIKSCGVSDDFIIYDKDDDARIGVYFYETGAAPRKPTVVYDRKYSSFTKISSDEIDNAIYSDVKLFHTSGISLAVTKTTGIEVSNIIKKFKDNGAVISFDVNFRATLWSEKESYETIKTILPLVDILFISQESIRKMFGKKGELKAVMEEFCAEYNIAFVATTMREVSNSKAHNFNAGIYSYAEDKLYTYTPYENIEVVDRIGSGDAFVGGALYGLIKHLDINKALSYGCALATHKMSIKGDLPICSVRDINNLINDHENKENSSEMNR